MPDTPPLDPLALPKVELLPYADHPVDRLYQAGGSVGISTDTRTITDVTLLTEYGRLVRTFGWGRDELLAVNLNAARAAFVAPAVQRDLEERLRDWWFPALEPLLAAHPDLRVYEVPMLASGYSLARPFINGGMAVAIPNPDVRERTLTVYTSVAKVIAALQIRSPETITILLVERSGRIAWRSEGAYAADKGAGLAHMLAAGSG